MTALRSPFRPALRRTLRRGRMHDPAIYSLTEVVRQVLYSNGEQGFLLDPSNLASMYQDVYGTTPVTGVDQPVGLMLDTRFGLERGDDLIVNGDFADGHDSWTTPNGDSFVAGGELHVVVTTATVSARSYQTLSGLVVGQFYEVTGNCREVAGGGPPRIRVGTGTSVTGAVSVNGDFRYVFFATTTSMNLLLISPNTILGSEAAFSNIAVRHIPGNHFYQSTGSARPVLKADDNGRYYLLFDGTDDCLMSNAIDFTGTDKVTVLAGITKLSDASTGVVVEASANAGNSAGAFGLYAPLTSGDASFTTRSHGTTAVTSTASGYASPVSAVITASADIGAPSLAQRINGASASGNTNSQGTGTYGNHPVFIGSRNNASNRFNGRLYLLAVRGALTQGHALEAAEALGFQKIRIAA